MDASVSADHTQVLDTMVALTRLSRSNRAIVVGSDSMQFYLALRRRGHRVATPATSLIGRGQYAIALVAGADSAASVEFALAEASRFLALNASLAALIRSDQSDCSVKMRARLRGLGFRIEAGVRCNEGFVLSAFRQGFAQMENAA